MSDGISWTFEQIKMEEQAAKARRAGEVAAQAASRRQYSKDGQRHYTPGQRLNSAAEVMQALLDGEKLKHKHWIDCPFSYLHLEGGTVKLGDGRAVNYPVSDFEANWLIYAPPKRKVKSERWFAVFQDISGPGWSSPFPTEDKAKGRYPNALTYVRAECEVEVD